MRRSPPPATRRTEWLRRPSRAEDEMPPGTGRGHPDVLDHALALDLAHGEGLAGPDPDRWRDLPAAAQVARRVRARALGRHPTLALIAREVLRADRARACLGQSRETAHAQGAEDVVFGRERRRRGD